MLQAHPTACNELNEMLALLPGVGVNRMVVGHSVQHGGAITAGCNGSVWRVDVGMSSGVLGSKAQVLELWRDGRVRVLSAADPPSLQHGEGLAQGLQGLVSMVEDTWRRINPFAQQQKCGMREECPNPVS